MIGPVAAVTGGTGFFGRYVAAGLARAGWHVRLLARRDPVHPLLADVPFELVPGDLRDPEALSRLVQGADAVVHAAGLVKAPNLHEFMAVNRDGAGRLASIVAREAPAARFILVSSLAAREPGLSSYAASKRAGEIAAVAALGSTPWVILRPCVIYGPWDYEGMTFLCQAQRRLVTIPAAPEPRIAMIHARDAAALVVALCQAVGVTAGTRYSRVTFELSDSRPDGYRWSEILQQAGVAFGRTPRFVPVPDLLFTAAGAAAGGWARATGRPSVFGRGKVREILYRDWAVDRHLQPPGSLWMPKIELAGGLDETIAWWQALRD